MSELTIRKATLEDIHPIVCLLANDVLGATREDASQPLNNAYRSAFEAIDADPNQYLAVAVVEDRVIGTLQLTFIPNISRLGAWRGQIEAVRVDESMRDKGLGRTLFEWAFEQCRDRGCQFVQLTCDHKRTGAHHIGFKKTL